MVYFTLTLKVTQFLVCRLTQIQSTERNRDGPEVMDPLRTAERAHRRICFLLSIKYCQVELHAQIPSSGRSVRALGRLLGCTQPMIKRPGSAIKYHRSRLG